MCCRGRERRDRGGSSPPPPPPPSLGAFGLAGSQTGGSGRELLVVPLPGLFFPPRCPAVGGEKLEAAALPPPASHRNLLWSEGEQRCRFPRDLLIHDFSLRTCGLLTLPWSVCALCRAGSDGSPPALLPLRQVSLHEEKMSVMLCRWEQKNVTMKLVGCFLLLGASLLLRNV